MKTIVILLTVDANSHVDNAFNNIVNYVGLRNVKTDVIEDMPFIKGLCILHDIDDNLSIEICDICEEHHVAPIFIDVENIDAIRNLEMLRFKL